MTGRPTLKSRARFAARTLAIRLVGRRMIKGLVADATNPRMRELRRLYGIQLRLGELSVVQSAVAARSNCRLLVFGLGNDSAFWRAVNPAGETCFIEDDAFWVKAALRQDPSLTVAAVTYTTRLDQWEQLLEDPDRLTLQLPPAVTSEAWDVILVDAPRGYRPDHPGRMQSIFMAAQLVSDDGWVFVHDCHRPVERRYADRFLGQRPDVRIDLLRGYRVRPRVG